MTQLEVGKKYWIKAEYKKLNEFNDFQHCFEVDGALDGMVMLDDVSEVRKAISEREKVTIPKEVADWIEEHKGQFSTVYTAFRILTKREYGIKKWVNENQDNFARAWLDGYKIEKEPLYWVRDNKGKSILYKDVEAGGKVTRSGGSNVSHQEGHSVKYTFTEQEIKAYDERFWAFAVPVEEE